MATIDLNSLRSDLLALSDSAVRKAIQKGANEAEAFLSAADIISVNIRKKTVECRRGFPAGLGIRVVVEGKVGFAAETGTSSKSVENAVIEAMSVARIRPLDPSFKHLPDPVAMSSKDGIIDRRIIGLSEDDALASVSELAKGALQNDERVKSLYGSLSVVRACYAVANSRGIEGSARTAYMKASARSTVADEGKQKTGSDLIVTRELVDFSQLGENATTKALKMLKAKPLGRTGKNDVIWESVSIGELYTYMLGAAADAENVIEGRSCYKNMLGKGVASKNVTAVDDGQLPEGIETSMIDGEGIPMRTTTIIEKGVLKSYIYNSYSSHRENVESTGNAKREWPEPFLQLPKTSTTNLVVNHGLKSASELVEEVGDGILVTDQVIGIGMSNLTTGEFSVVAPNAYLIEKGEITRPLESISVAGSFFEALKKVPHIGSDARLLDVGKIPSMVLGDLTVSG
ncbi:MAG: TldD/PmbA family protein [Candidatus Atabeyarchaeum deiterrae]